MAVLRVPQTYSTIQAAITAATTGDVIEIMPGIYSETLTISSKTYLTLRKVPGADGDVIVTSAATVVTLTNSIGTTFSEITFRLTGTATNVSALESVSSTCVATRLLDCVIDTTTMTGTANTTRTLVSLYPGTDTHGPTVVARCKFLTGSNKNWLRILYVIRFGAQQRTIIEGNYFSSPILRFTSSARVILVETSNTASTTVTIRNNTFRSGTTYGTVVRVMGTSSIIDLSTVRIYNNVVAGLNWSNNLTVFQTDTLNAANVFVGYNTVHIASGPAATTVSSPNSGGNVISTNATLLDGEGRLYFTKEGDLANGYELYRTGISDASLTVGQDQISFASPPSRGCYESYAHARGVSALFVPHRRLDPFNGMTHSGPGGSWAVTTSAAKEDFDSPMELASYINACLVGQMSTRYGPLTFYFDLVNRRYRMKSMTSIFDLSCSGTSAILFGTQNLSGVSDTG